MNKIFNKKISILMILLIVILVGIVSIILLKTEYTELYNVEIKAELSEIQLLAENYYKDNNTYFDFEVELSPPGSKTQLISPPKCSDKYYAIRVSPSGDGYLAYTRLCWSNTRIISGKRDAFWCVDSIGFSGELSVDSMPKEVYSCQ